MEKLYKKIESCRNECLKRAKITDKEYWEGKADAYLNVLTMIMFNKTNQTK